MQLALSLLTLWAVLAAQSGRAKVETHRPASFPHRIWAACDFEGTAPDYAWFGTVETKDLPAYAGNKTALRGETSKDGHFAYHVGINPVPGPRMGAHNKLYCRYLLRGASSAQFQHFNLTREDNHHVAVTGLDEDKWSEVTVDFGRDSKRNDGSSDAVAEGDRMDDLKIFLGKTGDDKRYEALIDDVIFFVDDPKLAVDPEPFPRRIIMLWGFDTGEKEKYWRGDLEIVDKPPAGANWRAAKAVPAKSGKTHLVTLNIAPPRPVGERTRLRFRYHLTGARSLIVQIFDVTVRDNRHVRLEGLEEGSWRLAKVDFTRDSKRNDGSSGPFTAGNTVDDLFFFVEPAGDKPVELFIDEVILYDAGG